MKAVPLGSQNTVEFTASLPFSQHTPCRMAHYLERDHPRVASALLKAGEMLHGLPKGSQHVTGGDRR